MQTNKLKTYAPQARRDFIAAVTRRAGLFGLSATGIAPAREEGELLLIDGQPHPRRIARQRAKLAERIRTQGFEQVMEATAYTWFNRLIAIRYMELHGFLDHSYRVLSAAAGSSGEAMMPEILEQAQHVELPGLDRERVIALKMDGTQDETLYRELLLAQCRALHQAMPFLFEPVDDETELLLPDRLLQTDSLIRALVSAIPEADWQPIEIIGWLYQFYIAEKKDQVIGKVVKSEDIPAATQLFTPNWIVKYMVQNSLGAQWLATYPDSPLKAQMDYYIEPAEQTPEVQAQLDAITPDSLDPEALTLMDPACGSGHILVEAYELFKAIYLERGYRLRDIPKLILEKNLYGLDIDPRAAQLAGFALMMKAREDDRRVLERGITLNVMALEESGGLRSEEVKKLGSEEGLAGAVDELVELFAHARTFGSLIQVPEGLAVRLPELRRLCERETGDLFVAEELRQLRALVRQAELLARKYDAVVANPPYMGSGGMNELLKIFAKKYYPRSKSDLFAISIERFFSFLNESAFVALMTPFTWMFLNLYFDLRSLILEKNTIYSLIQPEYHAFFDSAYVPICTFATRNICTPSYKGAFIKLSGFYGADVQSVKTLEAINDPQCKWHFIASSNDFKRIPGKPVAFWLSEKTVNCFSKGQPLGELVKLCEGLTTGDNELFLRRWPEVSYLLIDFMATQNADFNSRWAPYNKGGSFRRWYGNHDFVILWEKHGEKLRLSEKKALRNTDTYFQKSLSWSRVSSGLFALRSNPRGMIYDSTSPSIFSSLENPAVVLGFLNSTVVDCLLQIMTPTLDYRITSLSRLPVIKKNTAIVIHFSEKCVQIACKDWNTYERSWNFQAFPLLAEKPKNQLTTRHSPLTTSFSPLTTHHSSLATAYTTWLTQNRQTIAEMKRLEEENNRLFIDAYGLQDELTPEVPIDQITLTVNPAYRYGKKLSDDDWSVEHGFPEDLETRFREDSMQELVSYTIGCAMGRYSLDEPGLIYAHSGNQGFDPSRYTSFPADDDGILPITDRDWFEDDAANRLVEFIAVAWDKAHLEENLTFLADNLSPKKGETPRDTLRRYLADKFFKDHLQTYKKRPIYWCFSSGKQKAFQCLVYLHRYHQGTLARMRMEYVVPLLGKMTARLDSLADDIEAASSGAQAKRLQKERDTLGKQLDELRRFDEQLRHYADQRIKLDLDDGVKVNYGKFGDLLAEVKAVTGKSATT